MVFSLNAYPSSINISRNKAWDIVKSQILFGDTSNVNVYVSNFVYEANSYVKALIKDEETPNFSSWFFLIDDVPYASWEHACRYVFVNTEDGTFTIKNNTRPPVFSDMTNIVRQVIVKGSDTSKTIINKRNITNRSSSNGIHDYAVIISGGCDVENNHERYWNNCSALYSTLVNLYGYQRSHIYVIMADGTDPAKDMIEIDGSKRSQPLDLDGDGTNDIQYAATKQNISLVFNTLHNILTTDDNLLVYVTDHGGNHNGNCYFCLWGTEHMLSSEFATEINKVDAGNINVCLTQCYSGGFINDLQAANRTIITACASNEVATARMGYLYGEFSYQWISALACETPDGTTVYADGNNDGVISIWESYNYAKNHDVYCPNDENPQYSSTPSLLGRTLTIDNDNGFRGRYNNGTSTNNIILPYPLYTNSGGYVYIYSLNLIGATVTHQGTTPAYWSCNTTTGFLEVRFPSSGGTIVVHIEQNGFDYYLPILATNNSPYLAIELTNGVLKVLVLSKESDENNLDSIEKTYANWTIEIYNAITGNRVSNQTVDDDLYSVDTAGWDSGIYIIRVTIGDIILSEKIVIK